MTATTIDRLHMACERMRLRLHFRQTVFLLRSAGAHDGREPAARERTIRRLREYAAAARFPRHGGRGAPRPVFVDAAGTHCAVGFLLAAAGFAPLVDRIAAERNHARLADLAGVDGVPAALRAIGITPAEAARIQPTYTTSADCIPLFAFQVAALLLTPVLVLGIRHVVRPRDSGERTRFAARLLPLVILGAVTVLAWGAYPWRMYRDPVPEPGGVSFSMTDPPLPLYCGCVFSAESWSRLVGGDRAQVLTQQ